MKHEFLNMASNQWLNITGQNNSCVAHVLGGATSPPSIQEFLRSYLSGVSPSNGKKAVLESVSCVFTCDTDIVTPMLGEIYLVAADSVTQQTNFSGTLSPEEAIDSVMAGTLSFKKMGTIHKVDAPSTSAQWLKGSFSYRPSKKAREQGWDTENPDVGKGLWFVVVLYFGPQGLGITKNSQWVSKWRYNYNLTSNDLRL